MLGFNIGNADIVYIIIVYISSAIPWAYYIGKLRLNSDIRNYGDKNPGTVNVFRAGSITWGFIASFFEITKSGLPIYFFLSNYSIDNFTMIIFVIASLFGHGFSPFLKFKGGKSLAVTAGTWLAITKFEAFYIITPCLAIMKLIQKNDAITVTVAFSSLGIYLLLRNPSNFSTYSLLIGILFNLLFIIFKHRKEYKKKMAFRFKLK